VSEAVWFTDSKHEECRTRRSRGDGPWLRLTVRLLVISGFPNSNRHSVSENGDDSFKIQGLVLSGRSMTRFGVEIMRSSTGASFEK
jgi:hypothetical protein